MTLVRTQKAAPHSSTVRCAQNMAKALKVIGVTFSVIILVLFVVGYYTFSGMCANTIITSSTSPNKKWKVVVFERNCGATTGFSSQISLLKSNEELSNDAGNIYIAEGYPDGYNLKWESDSLVIIKGSNSKSNKKISQLNGVKFDYE